LIEPNELTGNSGNQGGTAVCNRPWSIETPGIFYFPTERNNNFGGSIDEQND